MEGKIQTVLGPISPAALGRTLTHEHVSLDFQVAYVPPSQDCSAHCDCDFSLPNLGWIRQNPYSHKKNIKFQGEDVEAAIMEELELYRTSGGGCVVENTTVGINRNIPFIKKLSKRTGVHIVAGTGYYVEGSQSAANLKLSEEQMAAEIRREVVEGCKEDTSVKCGLLGELGCSWPLTEFERRNLRAAAAVQAELGCPVMFHPGRNAQAPQEILRVYGEAGGDVAKAVMGHLDRTIHSLEELEEFAREGSYLEYDLFGIETSHYQLHPQVDMPSDAQRISRIKHLVQCGYSDRILLSHDIHTRNRLSAYGGHGFSHILRNVVPMMLTRGLTQQNIDQFLVENPQRWLTFSK